MNSSSYPNVLVISHNSFNKNRSNGKTLTSIFNEWNPNHLAQLYFLPETPDYNICKNYFRITDYDILKSIFFGKSVKITPLNPDNHPLKESNQENKLFSFFRGIKWPIISICRDLVWSSRKWDTLELQNWINTFSPDVVFFVGSNNKFSYDLTLNIVKNNNIPLITYFTDDYVTPKFTLNLFWWIHLFVIKKRFLIAKELSKKIFVIGDRMAEEYSSNYGGNFQPLMNIVEIPDYEFLQKKTNNNYFDIIYIGNISLNRWKSLHEIGIAILKLNNEGVKVKFTIYSLETLSTKVKKAIHFPPSVIFAGPIYDNELLKTILIKADMVVHVESFERKYRHLTRLSVSTKISEYLSYGKCIFAFGPEDIASIMYLKKNDAALVCTKKKEIYQIIRNIITDQEKQIKLKINSLLLAKMKHTKPNIKEIIIKVINE